MTDLSSDILEAQFGPTGLAVLSHDDRRRVISTLAGGRALEFSLVTFDAGGKAEFAGMTHDMAAGMSMGKAFRKRGVPFERQTRGVYAYGMPPGFRGRFGGQGKATVVEVSIIAGRDAAHYADILEVYAPEVDWPQDAARLPPAVKERLGDFDELLTELGH